MTTSPSNPWDAIILAIGGPEAFAARMGVSYSTMWRWKKGEVDPPKSAKEVINSLCAANALPPLFVVKP